MFLLFICDYQTHDHSTIAMIIKLVLLRITFSLKSGRAMSKTSLIPISLSHLVVLFSL